MPDSGTDERTDTTPMNPFDPPMIKRAEEGYPFPHLPPAPQRNTRDLILPPLFGIMLAATAVVAIALIFWPDSRSGNAASAAVQMDLDRAGAADAGQATIRVELSDPLAEVFVNDRLVDGSDPELSLEPGYHWVTITREGHHTLDSLVYLAPGAVLGFAAPRLKSFDDALVSVPADRPAFDVSSTASSGPAPAPATSRSQRQAPASAPPSSPVPSYHVTPDPEPESEPALVLPLARVPQIEPVPTEEVVPVEGRVAVTVLPWGSIFVEGRQIGANTDIRTTAALGEGTHAVEAVHPQLGSKTVYVAIVPGQTTEVVIDLR